ncbi:unnamed protein product [Cuscuta epithymum]|uniref:Uncharacterized protein n=1 Tax=Cuscuta epithymum TaxID=186058 RepID=A0AAV0GIU6_9ASTE|nr:unnamed protein product [Cuscuta epithymum]CAH9147673.1 unnamed protein product [Cuscuta epithymum]
MSSFQLHLARYGHLPCPLPNLSPLATFSKFHHSLAAPTQKNGCTKGMSPPSAKRRPMSSSKITFHRAISASLDLTEDNIKQVLVDARTELAQLFDTSVGITGKVELAEVDGPYVKISLSGKFWHKRSTVVARIGNYLKQRIPEILEVDIEDEQQLDDSPENF